MEGIGGIFSMLLNMILEFFQQKAAIFVEVSFGLEKPFAITVVNQSRFDILLNHLIVRPDGFPSVSNGWSINDANLFKDKLLKPGQQIRLYLSNNDIGENGKREFSINYSTIVLGHKIPRYEQTCEYNFDRDSHSIKVTSSASVNYEAL